MRYEFHPQALHEYREAAKWSNEREPLLALRFVDEVESTIRRVLDDPARFRI
jgi:ParE toxin of type II toxin-antitoxin system, parDE